MIPKPPSCEGCPAQSYGSWFVPDEVRPNAPVAIVAQNPGEDEEAGRRYCGGNTWEPAPIGPMTGKTGWLMDTTFLPLAGLTRDQVQVGNAIRCRWKGSNDLPPLESPLVRQAIAHCTRAYWKPPDAPRLIITQGAYALWSMTGEGIGPTRSMDAWRGWMVPYRPPSDAAGSPLTPASIYTPQPHETPVLATYHLAYLFRNGDAELPAKADWVKASRVLAGSWPQPLPPIATEPPDVWPAESAFDTEYPRHRPGERVPYVRYSLYDGVTLRVVEREHHRLPRQRERVRVAMHNAEADVGYLHHVANACHYDIEDTMYLHAVLHSGQEHTLDFLGSLYAKTNRWKHLVSTNPVVYSAGDALGAWDAWRALVAECARDRVSEVCYRNIELPLLPIIQRAHERGLRVDQSRVTDALGRLKAILHEETLKAQAAVGWPINLGSPPQVGHQIHRIEGRR